MALSVDLFPDLDLEKLHRHSASVHSVPKSRIPSPPVSPISGDLTPYSGPWTRHTAAHLLRRTMFGPTRQNIQDATEQGLDATIALLLQDQPGPEPPINYNYPDDPNTPVGETWIDKPTSPEFFNYRRRSTLAWINGLIIEEGVSVREKMTLFWHNHFVTSDLPIPKLQYQYISLLRSHALGNFKQLVKEVTINPAMLYYLNGNQNTRFAPNENYARELLELFTVGKGPLAGPGDYTTFTEDDVREISRILTGWRIRFEAETGAMPEAFFNVFLHDTGRKTLSHRFQDAQIQNADENEYANLIDVIFQSPDASRFICRKLYRWFVYYVIDETIESNVIEPLAQILRENDFDIKPVLRALFRSTHFYDINSIGCMIKHPIEFLSTNIKQFEIPMPQTPEMKYALWFAFYNYQTVLQMQYLYPPDVAGWKPFYQAPAYYQLWINASTLQLRFLYTDVISTVGFEAFGRQFRIDVLTFTAGLEDPLDPNALIRSYAELVFPNGITQAQHDALKEVLIPGLPDFEWTVEYTNYLQDPDNEIVRLAVELKLRNLLRTMLAMAEYQLT